MAIEVRIPTILRTHTGGNKVVEGSGATLGALVDDIDGQVTEEDVEVVESYLFGHSPTTVVYD